MARVPRPTRPERRQGAKVSVQVATRAARLPAGTDLGGWVAAAAGSERGEVTVRLVGWPEGRRLNQHFRGKPAATNVLSFPAPAPMTAAAGELGDLVICLPLVWREAREQGKRPLHHLAHLVVHGTLHLLGHDHDQDAAARKMENREKRIMARLGFPDPYSPGKPTRVRAPRRQRT
jgi:probable rRNA maturation factor